MLKRTEWVIKKWTMWSSSYRRKTLERTEWVIKKWTMWSSSYRRKTNERNNTTQKTKNK